MSIAVIHRQHERIDGCSNGDLSIPNAIRKAGGNGWNDWNIQQSADLVAEICQIIEASVGALIRECVTGSFPRAVNCSVCKRREVFIAVIQLTSSGINAKTVFIPEEVSCITAMKTS